jgi:hypothetical protein
MLQGIIVGVCLLVAVLLIGAMVFVVVREETRFRRYCKAMAKFNEQYWKEYEDAQE